MSRVTNSVLLRYGINLFWSSWSFSSKLLNSSLQFNTFFSLFLRNYFLKILKIQYSDFIITLYFFYLRDQKLSFLNKYLKLNKILKTNLNLRKNYALNLSKKNSFQIQKNISFLHLQKLILLISFFLCFIRRLLIIKRYNKRINYRVEFTKNIYLGIKNVTKYNKRSLYRVKIKFINNLIKIKLLGLICSMLIFFYAKQKYLVNFKSLTDKKQDFKFPFLFNTNKYLVGKQRVYLIYLSFMFLKASILNVYINILVKEIKDKKHINIIRGFFDNIKVLFQQQFIPISGIKFQIAGRLNGKLRKSRFGYNMGSIKLMSFYTLCNYSCDIIYTQYGSFSLKLWLCANTEHSLIS